jgi:release factor glutamine methyltransferase
MTVGEALAHAAARLAASSESARLDAELLLGAVLDASRTQLLLRREEVFSADQAIALDALLARRVAGEPVPYLTGRQGFWTLDLRVTPDVLVPRPETELLVEWALELCRDTVAGLPSSVRPELVEGRVSQGSSVHGSTGSPRTEDLVVNSGRTGLGGLDIADLGTGSGAIALALARERPRARVIATDASAAALAVAAGNARELQLTNVDFRAGSWYVPLAGESFELIVSNPPYIAAGDPHLPALRHEPVGALTDGGDGLSCLREIIAEAPRYLRPGGWLLVEHGYDQGEAVRALFAAAGLRQVSTRRDLGGQERCTGGCRA